MKIVVGATERGEGRHARRFYQCDVLMYLDGGRSAFTNERSALQFVKLEDIYK
jgi:hypothetical protein